MVSGRDSVAIMSDEPTPAGDLPPLEVLDEFWASLRERELAGDDDVQLERWISTWAVDHECDADVLVEHAARMRRDLYFEDDRDT
jgi:hypothetical protein